MYVMNDGLGLTLSKNMLENQPYENWIFDNVSFGTFASKLV